MLPITDERPRFAQLYIVELNVELDQRLSCFLFDGNVEGVDNNIVCGLRNMLDGYNEIAKVFLTAREMHTHFRELPIRIKFLTNQSRKDHNNSSPTVPEITTLIVVDIVVNDHERDIIVEHRQEGLKKISDLHILFMPLQYQLFFPYEEDCFHLNIPYEESLI